MMMRRSQSGNIFFALFGAVGLVGVLGAATMTIMKGPVRSMAEVTKRTVAENAMIAAGRLSLSAATQGEDGGDCDGDGYVEPIVWSETGTGIAPVGGGFIPSTIGAAQQDPWGTTYGYCAWDHGSAVDDAGCGGAVQLRLDGQESEDYVAIAVISAGANRTFETSCGDTPDYLTRVSGSDDIILEYTYGESSAMGLWRLKSGDPETAEIGARNIEVAGSGGAGAARIGYDADLDMAGVGDFLAIKTDHVYAQTGGGDVAFHNLLKVASIEDLDLPVAGGVSQEVDEFNGMIAAFGGACPDGWTEVTDLHNRMVIGAGDSYAVGNTGGAASVTLTTAQLPSHTHSVDPPSTSSNTVAAHTHSVNPPNTSTNTTGAHTHTYSKPYKQYTMQPGGADDVRNFTTDNTSSSGNHSHTVNIPAFNSGGGGSHNHSVNIAAFNSGSVGSGLAHENRPPYRAYTYCSFDGDFGISVGGADTLAGLSCASGEVAKYNGSIWECAADGGGAGSDTLSSLSCNSGEIAKWNGSAWACAEDVGGSAEDSIVDMVAAFDAASCPAGWEEATGMQGRMIIGTGTLGSDTYGLGDTGGAASVTLSEAQMPAHNHSVDPPSTSTGTDGNHNHDIKLKSRAGSHTHEAGDRAASLPDGGSSYTSGSTIESAGSHAHTVDIAAFVSVSAGSGEAHENRPPYKAYIICKYVGGGSIGGMLGDVGCDADEILKWDGDSWECAADGAGGSSVWSTSGSDTYYNTGNVGIGTSDPEKALHIHGTDANARLRVTRDGGTGEFGAFEYGGLVAGAPNLRFYTGSEIGSETLKMTILESGNVGIGTDDPARALHVVADTANAQLRLERTGTNAGISADIGGNSGNLIFYPGGYDDNTGDVIFDTSGNVGIGTSGPRERLDITDSGRIIGDLIYLGYGSTGGSSLCYSTSGLHTSHWFPRMCSSSSIRYKENIQPIGYGLDSVMRLHPVSFDYKQSYDVDRHKDHIGFIAEEVDKVVPEVVVHDPDGNVETLNYDKLTPVLAKAIQELKSLFDGLAEKLAELAGKVPQLFVITTAHEARIAALEDENRVLRARLDEIESTLTQEAR